MQTYPLEHDLITPPNPVKRLSGQNPYHPNLPDGIHTGGPWLCEDKMVWKPLDAKPYANADVRVETLEAVFLEKFAGSPMFPRNWQVEEYGGRRFLVRPEVYLVNFDERLLDKDDVLTVEKAIRYVNSHGWEIGDDITLGHDRDGLFVLDLSCAHESKGQGGFAADELWRIDKFLNRAGFDRIAILRSKAHRVIVDNLFKTDRELTREHRHVYASFNRPISLMWASIPKEFQSILLDEKYGDWEKLTPWTWIVTVNQLPDDLIYNYELTWGWSPIPRLY